MDQQTKLILEANHLVQRLKKSSIYPSSQDASTTKEYLPLRLVAASDDFRLGMKSRMSFPLMRRNAHFILQARLVFTMFNVALLFLRNQEESI